MRKAEQKSRKYAKRLRQNPTSAEAIMWAHLKGKKLNGHRFRRQHPVGPYIADFACVAQKLIVEIDGATHSTAQEIAHDQQRTGFLTSKGWRVLRITNPDVYDNLEGVLEAIAAELPPPPASPAPPPQAEEENRRGILSSRVHGGRTPFYPLSSPVFHGGGAPKGRRGPAVKQASQEGRNQ